MDAGIRTNEAVNSVYKQLRVDRKIKALVMKINEKTEFMNMKMEEKISRLSSFYGLLLTVKPYKR